jgi:hypothetical protein
MKQRPAPWSVEMQALRPKVAKFKAQKATRPGPVIIEGELRWRADIVPREFHDFLRRYIRMGLIESPIIYCSGRPGRLLPRRAVER